MFEYKGFPSTEWPMDWVRSLIREIEWNREAARFTSLNGTDLTELDHWLDGQTNEK